MISTDDIVKRVRVLINEAEEEKSISLLTEDARSFDKSIRTLIPQAVSIIQGNKQPGKRVNVRSVVPSSAVIADNGDGSGYIALPADFVSLVILGVSGWERPCSVLYPASSQQAAWQRNSSTRAGKSRPVCVVCVDSAGNRVAELYPLPDAARLESLVYEASFNPDAGLDGYDDGMDDAVAYQCAALLYNMFEKYDASKSFLSYSLALCNGSVNVKK